MATSQFFMSSTNELSTPVAVPGGSAEAKAEPIQRQLRARRPNRTMTQQTPNKQRRRGLGVAELERLSIQERLMKMPPQQYFPAAAAAPTKFLIQSSPFVGAPDQAASYGFHGYCMASTPASPFPGTGRGFVVPASSSGYATGGVLAGRVVGSPGYGFIEAPVHHGSGNNNVLLEVSRELSSMPNAQCNLDCCSTCCCFKKKGSSNHVGVDHRARSERNRDRSIRSITRMQQQDNARDFLGLNLGNIYYGGSTVCCEGTPVGYGGDICTTHTQSAALEKEVEVMEVRRKGKNSLSVGGGGGGGGRRGSSSRVVLEFEFFPRMGSCSTRSSLPQDLNIPCSVVDQDSAASACFSATTKKKTTCNMISGGGGGGSYYYEGAPAHSSIDLSLRLSSY